MATSFQNADWMSKQRKKHLKNEKKKNYEEQMGRKKKKRGSSRHAKIFNSLHKNELDPLNNWNDSIAYHVKELDTHLLTIPTWAALNIF